MSPDEIIDADAPNLVWAESIGVGVVLHEVGPEFAVALNMPGGGRAMYRLDVIGTIEYATSLLSAVSTAMTEYEKKRDEQ